MKQIQVSEKNPPLNVFDFDFFVCCAQHPKMQLKLSLLLFDLLLKIYLDNLYFASLARKTLSVLLRRHLEALPFQEYLLKTQGILLSMFIELEKKRKNQGDLRLLQEFKVCFIIFLGIYRVFTLLKGIFMGFK